MYILKCNERLWIFFPRNKKKSFSLKFKDLQNKKQVESESIEDIQQKRKYFHSYHSSHYEIIFIPHFPIPGFVYLNFLDEFSHSHFRWDVEIKENDSKREREEERRKNINNNEWTFNECLHVTNK